MQAGSWGALLDSSGGNSGEPEGQAVTREVGRGGSMTPRHGCAGEGRLGGEAVVRGMGTAEAGVEEMEAAWGYKVTREKSTVGW